MPPTEIIEISYSINPPGQVGTKPRKVKKNQTFRIITHDPGDFKIEFTNGSPLATGNINPLPGADLVPVHTGTFPFKCTLNGVVIPAGGEVEIDSGE
jgi:hypothetical protein